MEADLIGCFGVLPTCDQTIFCLNGSVSINKLRLLKVNISSF